MFKPLKIPIKPLNIGAKKIAVVLSRYHERVAQSLLQACLSTLKENHVAAENVDVYTVTGAYEIPWMVKWVLKGQEYVGAITLGCVIRGETPHFDYICQAVSWGCMQVGLAVDRPVAFGVLTVDTEAQALVRSSDDEHNKGRETALALIETLGVMGSQ